MEVWLKDDTLDYFFVPTHCLSVCVCVCSVQVSKTDPSPKREMPTMILFNVVFALRVSPDLLNTEFKHGMLECG